jgi:hypothetical protein
VVTTWAIRFPVVNANLAALKLQGRLYIYFWTACLVELLL